MAVADSSEVFTKNMIESVSKIAIPGAMLIALPASREMAS
jgi:hypothetical protein